MYRPRCVRPSPLLYLLSFHVVAHSQGGNAMDVNLNSGARVVTGRNTHRCGGWRHRGRSWRFKIINHRTCCRHVDGIICLLAIYLFIYFIYHYTLTFSMLTCETCCRAACGQCGEGPWPGRLGDRDHMLWRHADDHGRSEAGRHCQADSSTRDDRIHDWNWYASAATHGKVPKL